MYTLNINLMDTLTNLSVRYLQYQQLLVLLDMFVEKKEKLYLEKKQNKQSTKNYL